MTVVSRTNLGINSNAHVQKNKSNDVVFLYSVEEAVTSSQESQPFIYHVTVRNPKTGTVMRIKGLIDDGAMVNVVNTELWPQLAARLGDVMPSNCKLHMANGAIVPSQGQWEGEFDFEGINVRTSFELFPSRGAWSFLIGKPMLEALHAQHDYAEDIIVVRGKECSAIVKNQQANTWGDERVHANGLLLTLDAKMCTPCLAPNTSSADSASTSNDDMLINRSTESNTTRKYKVSIETVYEEDEPEIGSTTRQEKTTAINAEHDQERYIGPDAPELEHQDLHEIPVNAVHESDDKANNIYTRTTDPFKAEHIQAILNSMQIGNDLGQEERKHVQQLIREYADCFVLSIKEVTPVPGAVHTLNVPPDATFSKRVHQKPLTPPQRAYVHKKIDKLIEAGAIEPCSPSKVKCIAPITLAHKAHKGTGLSMEELQRRVNEECKAANLPNPFNVPKRPEGEQRIVDPPPVNRKWHICHNFGEINKVTEIAAMPQGDILLGAC